MGVLEFEHATNAVYKIFSYASEKITCNKQIIIHNFRKNGSPLRRKYYPLLRAQRLGIITKG